MRDAFARLDPRFDVWLVRKRARYVEEDARLRESMSGLQRQQADAILSNEQNKVRMMIELVRRQAQIDKQLHLAIPVDSGGHFAARYDTSGKISRGTLKVVGRFKSRHSAAGTLNWKVKTRKGNHTCKSGNVHFTAHNP